MEKHLRSRSLLIAALLGISCAGAQEQAETPQQPVIEPGAGVEASMPAPLPTSQFTGRVLEIQDDVFRLVLPEEKEERTLRMKPELLQALGAIPDRDFSFTLDERALPSGVVTGLALRDERGLYAVVESIGDRQMLRPEDRAGMNIEPVPGERTLVYESECEIVYNVPTTFSIGDSRYVLQAYETQDVSVEGVPYTLSLQTSRWTVQKPCSAVHEGAQSQVEYALVRQR